MTKEEIKGLDCMIQHLQTFSDQSSERRMANFAEPCSECERFEECQCDWLGNMDPLFRQANVSFSPVVRAYRRKQDKKNERRT